jgi:hypothetical protein
VPPLPPTPAGPLPPLAAGKLPPPLPGHPVCPPQSAVQSPPGSLLEQASNQSGTATSVARWNVTLLGFTALETVGPRVMPRRCESIRKLWKDFEVVPW